MQENPPALPRLSYPIPLEPCAYRHCEYQELEALQVPEEQQVAPAQPLPPHCPYRAAQLPPAAGTVEVVAGAEVVLVPGAAEEVVVLLLLLLPSLPSTKARACEPYSEP